MQTTSLAQLARNAEGSSWPVSCHIHDACCRCSRKVRPNRHKPLLLLRCTCTCHGCCCCCCYYVVTHCRRYQPAAGARTAQTTSCCHSQPAAVAIRQLSILIPVFPWCCCLCCCYRGYCCIVLTPFCCTQSSAAVLQYGCICRRCCCCISHSPVSAGTGAAAAVLQALPLYAVSICITHAFACNSGPNLQLVASHSRGCTNPPYRE